MEAPFEQLPDASSVPEPNELMRGTLARARTDWPNLDSVLSLDAVRAPAKLPGCQHTAADRAKRTGLAWRGCQVRRAPMQFQSDIVSL